MDAYVGKRSNADSQFALDLADLGRIFPHPGVVALDFCDPVSLPCLPQCAPALAGGKAASCVRVD